MGSLYGFKCDDPHHCDCSELGQDLEPFDVMKNEAIYVMNHQLSPGRYCLPKGVSHCDQNTSYQIFTSSGWTCVPRTVSPTICHSKDTHDNSGNVLWDRLENKKAEKVLNVYEKLKSDNSWRYQCKCDARDMFNRQMVKSTPWTCSIDYCIAEILNVTSGMGFDGSECQCGTTPHADPNDKKSPCKLEISEIKNHKFTGRVDCTSEISMKKHSIFCPPGEGVLRSEELTVMSFANLDHFLDAYLK